MHKLIRLLNLSLFSISMLFTFQAHADVQKVIKQCESCHGQNGNSRKNDIPSIASFSVSYMQDVMSDFKNNKRQGKRVKPNASAKPMTMNEVVKQVNPNDLKAAYQHFARQKFIPARQPSNPALAEKGKKIYKKKCKKCHGDNGNDPEDDAAILKGQWQPYLKAQLKEFQANKRPTPKKMKKQLKKLKPGQLEALMHYFAQP